MIKKKRNYDKKCESNDVTMNTAEDYQATLL